MPKNFFELLKNNKLKEIVHELKLNPDLLKERIQNDVELIEWHKLGFNIGEAALKYALNQNNDALLGSLLKCHAGVNNKVFLQWLRETSLFNEESLLVLFETAMRSKCGPILKYIVENHSVYQIFRCAIDAKKYQLLPFIYKLQLQQNAIKQAEEFDMFPVPDSDHMKYYAPDVENSNSQLKNFLRKGASIALYESRAELKDEVVFIAEKNKKSLYQIMKLFIEATQQQRIYIYESCVKDQYHTKLIELTKKDGIITIIEIDSLSDEGFGSGLCDVESDFPEQKFNHQTIHAKSRQQHKSRCKTFAIYNLKQLVASGKPLISYSTPIMENEIEDENEIALPPFMMGIVASDQYYDDYKDLTGITDDTVIELADGSRAEFKAHCFPIISDPEFKSPIKKKNHLLELDPDKPEYALVNRLSAYLENQNVMQIINVVSQGDAKKIEDIMLHFNPENYRVDNAGKIVLDSKKCEQAKERNKERLLQMRFMTLAKNLLATSGNQTVEFKTVSEADLLTMAKSFEGNAYQPFTEKYFSSRLGSSMSAQAMQVGVREKRQWWEASDCFFPTTKRLRLDEKGSYSEIKISESDYGKNLYTS